jgi:hypothetical protein
MNMVGHEAISIDFAAKLLFPFLEVFKVELVVLIMDKNSPLIVSALNYMMRISG